jgi:hypothetical protein
MWLGVYRVSNLQFSSIIATGAVSLIETICLFLGRILARTLQYSRTRWIVVILAIVLMFSDRYVLAVLMQIVENLR